jgi:hypothetical protein
MANDPYYNDGFYDDEDTYFAEQEARAEYLEDIFRSEEEELEEGDWESEASIHDDDDNEFPYDDLD